MHIQYLRFIFFHFGLIAGHCKGHRSHGGHKHKHKHEHEKGPKCNRKKGRKGHKHKSCHKKGKDSHGVSGWPEWVLFTPHRDRDRKRGTSDRMAVIDQQYFTNLPKFEREYKWLITPCILIEKLNPKRKKNHWSQLYIKTMDQLFNFKNIYFPCVRFDGINICYITNEHLSLNFCFYTVGWESKTNMI